MLPFLGWLVAGFILNAPADSSEMTARSADETIVLSAHSSARDRGATFDESPIELSVRLMWERQPFTSAKNRLEAVLNPELATEVAPEPSHAQNPFAAFYDGLHYRATVHNLPDKRQKRQKNTYRLDIAYDGAAFHGWQIQLDRRTVQGQIQAALGGDVRVSGRTDRGVHATAQVGRIKTTQSLDQVEEALEMAAARDQYQWRCWNVEPIGAFFHPTFQCTSRFYAYMIDRSALEECLTTSTSALSIEKLAHRLDASLRRLEGKRLDCVGCSMDSRHRKDTKCCLSHAQCRLLDDGLVVELAADRFLRRMVRILVGSALTLALDSSFSATSLLKAIETRERSVLGKTAPPDGLVLVGVAYG